MAQRRRDTDCPKMTALGSGECYLFCYTLWWYFLKAFYKSSYLAELKSVYNFEKNDKYQLTLDRIYMILIELALNI